MKDKCRTEKRGGGSLQRMVRRLLERRIRTIGAEHTACDREIDRLEKQKKRLLKESSDCWGLIDADA